MSVSNWGGSQLCDIIKHHLVPVLNVRQCCISRQVCRSWSRDIGVAAVITSDLASMDSANLFKARTLTFWQRPPAGAHRPAAYGVYHDIHILGNMQELVSLRLLGLRAANEDQISRLSDAIRALQALRNVNISLHLENSALFSNLALARALGTLRNLHRFELKINCASSCILEAAAIVLCECKLLRVLSITNGVRSPDAEYAAALSKFNEALATSESLQKLKLNGIPLYCEDSLFSFGGIARNTSLVALSIVDCQENVGRTGPLLAEALATNGRLTKLVLLRTLTESEDLAPLVKQIGDPSKSLLRSFSYHGSFSQLTAENLANLTSLTDLKLHYWDMAVDFVSLVPLFRKAPLVSCSIISSTFLYDTDFGTIWHAFEDHTTLQNLTVLGKVGWNSASYLTSLLEMNSVLKSLTFQYDVNDSKFPSYLCGHLAKNSRLTRLHLDVASSNGVEMTNLLTCLAKNTTIQELKLRVIGGEPSTLVAPLLRADTALSIVDLYFKAFSPMNEASAEEMFEALAHNRKIRSASFACPTFPQYSWSNVLSEDRLRRFHPLERLCIVHDDLTLKGDHRRTLLTRARHANPQLTLVAAGFRKVDMEYMERLGFRASYAFDEPEVFEDPD